MSKNSLALCGEKIITKLVAEYLTRMKNVSHGKTEQTHFNALGNFLFNITR